MAGLVPRLLLAVALLVPTAVLVMQAWQATSEKQSFAERERAGIEYLRALEPLTFALVEAQSAAVSGQPAPTAALDRAIAETTAVDGRLGSQLRTTERWTGIRDRVDGLSQQRLAGMPAYQAFSEVADLLLALYAKVRDTSGLIRDPDPDSYQLQDAAGEELPESVIATGRLADLTVLAANRPPAELLRTAGELTSARLAVLSPADDLVDDLQAAVDSTDSGTLGSALIGGMDAYQRAVEALATAAQLADDGAPPAPGAVAAARNEVQTAAATLSDTVLTELDGLVAARADSLTTPRLLTVTAGILLFLIGHAPLLLFLFTRTRHRAPASTADPSADPARTAGPADGPSLASALARRIESSAEPSGVGPNGHLNPADGRNPAGKQWERTGATR